MSRDWQKDMDWAKTMVKLMDGTGKHVGWTKPLMYWLQQYAAEKERAERLQEALEKAQYYLMREAYLPAEGVVDEALSSLYPLPERGGEA